MPALAGLLVAAGLATATGVALSRLTPTAGGTPAITLQSMAPGSQAAAHLRLSQPALPIECRPAAWIHATLAGRCPLPRSAAEAAARSALPVVVVTLPIAAARAAVAINGATPAPASAQPQVREAVLAWADLPAWAFGANPSRALHGLVWVVAVDELFGPNSTCPALKRASSLVTPCVATTRYLVFVDALSGRSRLVTSRP